jgi:ATP-dependent protease ClpP protease subunit
MSVIELYGDFNPEMAKHVCDGLYKAQKQGEKRATIAIDSNGGYVDSLEDIILCMETMRAKKMKVDTYNLRKAYSCGSMLLSFGDIRYMHPRAESMIHAVGVASLPGGRIDEIEERVKELRKFNDKWFTWLAKNLSISKRKLDNITHATDLFLDPKESKKIGLIDKIEILS